MVDEVGQYTMEVANKNKIRDTKTVPAVSDSPQVGGVKSGPETSILKPTRNVSIVAIKATERETIGRSVMIQINLDPVRPDKEIGRSRTTLEDWKDPKLGRSEKGLPL